MTDAVLKGRVQRARRHYPIALRPGLLAHVGKPCPYCSRPMADRGRHMVSRDHILSRLLMAQLPDRERLWRVNSIIVCQWCNGDKDAMTLFAFAAMQTPGAPRDVALRGLLLQLRLVHPHDVFIALTGSPR